MLRYLGMMSQMDQDLTTATPVAIAVAPNGGRRGKADHPALPTTPSELAETAARCLAAGAAMIHVHVRDATGRHLLDVEAYRSAMDAIRAAVGDRLVVQATSESLGLYSPAQQMALVRALKPEAVSLALRELAPNEAAEPAFADFLLWLLRERITPQIILYDASEVARLETMSRRGLAPFETIPVLYALGRYAPGQRSQPTDLLPFLAARRSPAAHWMVCAFGWRETACVTAAALLGGHIRVGFENNLHRPDGALAADNAELVEAAAKAIAATGLARASADALRGAWRVEA
jgi:3-keto-5-aminohexanoate cleavage enzyme